VRERALKEIEAARNRKEIGDALEAQVEMHLTGDTWVTLQTAHATLQNCWWYRSWRSSRTTRIHQHQTGRRQQMPALLEPFYAPTSEPHPNSARAAGGLSRRTILNLRGKLSYLLIIPGIILLDQLSKLLVYAPSHLERRHQRLLPHLPGAQLRRRLGAVLRIRGHVPRLITLLAIVAFGVVIGVFLKTPPPAVWN